MNNHYDLIVYGGGLGGVAATIAAARTGATTLLVVEGDWVGGQVTSQAVPPDEHPWIEEFGCSGSYRDFRTGVREFYRQHFPLNAAARRERNLNPGKGNVGPLTHEPYVAQLVLDAMLYPWVSRGLVRILRRTTLAEVDVVGDTIRSLTLITDGSQAQAYSAHYFLDASELGDLVDRSGTEHVIGAESAADTGELHALSGVADPLDQQAITWGMVLGYTEGEEFTIAKPAGYDRWRTHQPSFWPGPVLGWDVSDFITHQPRHRPLFTTADSTGFRYDLWSSRRILAADQFDGSWRSDVTAAVWPMMDYYERPLLGVSDAEREVALAEARELSLSLLYWMQTEAPRHDGGTGYPGLHTRPDLTGTLDGLAKEPYIREARRIVPQFRVTESHVGVEARPGADSAEKFDDSVGIGAYRIDLHPSTAGRNTVDTDSWPFQIPLGALLPVRVRNLLPAAKNIGTTHITNGAYRVHPVEWAIGEAAGALAAYCVEHRVAPEQVRGTHDELRQFQAHLSQNLEVPLDWPQVDALRPTNRFGYTFGASSSTVSR